jgi:hypothetical protein
MTSLQATFWGPRMHFVIMCETYCEQTGRTQLLWLQVDYTLSKISVRHLGSQQLKNGYSWIKTTPRNPGGILCIHICTFICTYIPTYLITHKLQSMYTGGEAKTSFRAFMYILVFYLSLLSHLNSIMNNFGVYRTIFNLQRRSIDAATNQNKKCQWINSKSTNLTNVGSTRL